MESLEKKWLNLWEKIDANGKPIKIFNVLSKLYSGPKRFYHNFNHIADCLDEFNQAQQIIKRPMEVETAIWFHDAVYDTRMKDNEEKSAELFYKISKEVSLPQMFSIRIRNMILATDHKKIPNDTDTKVLLDIDLSILGKDQGKYEKYEENIRKEYGWVPKEQFRKGRTNVLQGFLKRPSIYLTDFFRKKYEIQAETNLRRTLSKL